MILVGNQSGRLKSAGRLLQFPGDNKVGEWTVPPEVVGDRVVVVTQTALSADRVGCRGLRPGTLPHHRTCGFPHPAVERSGPSHGGRKVGWHPKPVTSQRRVA